MITRVWGEADGFSLEFSRNGSGGWEATVLPDLEDGQYAVQLYALNDIGAIGIYTGMLYLCDGLSCLHIFDERIRFALLPELIGAAALPERIAFGLVPECAEHQR